MRAAIRRIVIHSLHYSGLLCLLAAARLRRRIAVLTYHRVLPDHLQNKSFSSPGIIVTPETFDRHVRFIKRHLRPIDVRTFERIVIHREDFRPGTCVVTFDDGWWDNLEFALPILRRHQVPAVIFVATDYIGSGRCFWQEQLSRRLFRMRNDASSSALLRQLGLGTIIGAPAASARTTIRKFVDELKMGTLDDIRATFARLDEVSPDTSISDVDRFLTWDELPILAEDRWFSIASHGKTHTPFTRLTHDAIRRELADSDLALRSRLGVVANALAYPNGDADAGIAATVRGSGIVIGFTTARGLVSGDQDPLLLPRINMHESAAYDTATFLYRLLGLTR